jgi:outer membrane protein OmpA-like peptidoglycan-associated protein
MRFVFTCLLQLILVFQLFSQTKYLIRPENADCKKAIEIKDTVFGPTNAPGGYGSVMEISGDKSSLYAFEKEHNTCWYYFKGKNDCLLEIEIIPEKINDDYDFVLYKYSGKTFCQDVTDKKVNPVRTCISRNDKTNGSKTGLSKQAPDEYIHSGPGASYSKSIFIKKGEVYYLCVDNVYPNGGGHTIILHYSDCAKPSVVKQTDSKITNNSKSAKTKDTPLQIMVVDKDTQLSIKANIKIFDKKLRTTEPQFSFDSVSSCNAKLSYSVFNIKAEADNYFDDIREIKTCSCGSEMIIKIALSRIKVGQNVVFENILFFGNCAQFLPESQPVLEGIATTMKRNPGLDIEIQGHVNCPNGWSDCDKKTEFNMELSINRARAVFDFLNNAGIATTRMTYKGFGATRMIYPNARSEDKMEKNRRVEIVVTAFH